MKKLVRKLIAGIVLAGCIITPSLGLCDNSSCYIMCGDDFNKCTYGWYICAYEEAACEAGCVYYYYY